MATRVLSATYHEVWAEAVQVGGAVTIQTGIPVIGRDPAELSRMVAILYLDAGAAVVSKPTCAINPATGNLDVSFTVAGGTVAYTLDIHYHQPQGVDATYAGLGLVVGGSGGTPISEADFWHETIQPSVAGQLTYWIPVGCYYRTNPQDIDVAIDTGSGWIPQAYGADFGYKQRNTAPATVADLAIGVMLNDPPPANWQIRIRWRDRRILIEPPPIAKVRLTGVGGTPDYSVKWGSNGPTPPNAITIPERTGFQVEFWRLSRRNGGLWSSLHPAGHRRMGRRYIPYFRGVVDLWTFHMNELRSTVGQPYSRMHYRACYVNPTTGARSALSPDIIVSNVTRDEHCGGKTYPFRRESSMWIDE